MANDPLALAGFAAGLPQDAEYDAVYAAVTATERGRWFLAEYADRNRHADTDLVMNAIARIEAAVRGDGPDVAAAAERIADIAFALRERAADAGLCDALDAAVKEISGACATVAAANGSDGASKQEREADPAVGAIEFELQDEKKFAAAAAALGASLAALGQDSQSNGEASARTSVSVVPPQDYEPVPAAHNGGPPNDGPRWFIEAPDFVFGPAARGTDESRAESPDQSGKTQSLLPLPQLLADPQDDPADLFEPAAAAPAIELAAPQLRVAAVAPTRSAPRPAPSNPLAALRALSEEELIALFG